MVQDSAGVRIITNTGPGAWEGQGWTVEEDLRIGVDAGDPELQFGLIAGVHADDQGRIVVLDAQAGRIRVFGPDGGLLHAFGRVGGGPGEISQALTVASRIFVEADGSVAVPDLGNMRLARFTFEGEPLDSPRLSLEDGIPLLFKGSADRELLVQVRQMAMPGMDAPEGGPTDRIVRLEPGTTEGETLATLPAGETFSLGPDGMPRFRFFSPELVWEILHDGRVVTGTNDTYSLRLTRGDEVTIVRRETTRHPVTERATRELREAIRQSILDSGQPIPPEALDMIVSQMEFAEHWPALAALLAGPDGTLWVQRVDPSEVGEDLTMEDLQSGRIGAPDWDVFDAEGTYLGRVRMPARFMPHQWVGDALYGVHFDELEIQRAVRLRLVR
jgi:hypothetical protein